MLWTFSTGYSRLPRRLSPAEVLVVGDNLDAEIEAGILAWGANGTNLASGCATWQRRALDSQSVRIEGTHDVRHASGKADSTEGLPLN
jgi:hypothetical protein